MGEFVMEEIRNEKSAADNITGCKVKGRALLNMVQELTKIREMSRLIKSANGSEIDAPVDKSKSRSMSSPSVKTFQMQPRPLSPAVWPGPGAA
jgi:hypothetical protein